MGSVLARLGNYPDLAASMFVGSYNLILPGVQTLESIRISTDNDAWVGPMCRTRKPSQARAHPEVN